MTLGFPIPDGTKLALAFQEPSAWYGLTSNKIVANAAGYVRVTGGNGAWGTELWLYDGATITSNYYNLQKLFIMASENANRKTHLEIFGATKGAEIAGAFKNTGNLVQIAKNVIADGTKVVLGATLPSEVNVNTVYYTVGYSAGAGTDPNTIQLSLTEGGGAITLGSDTTGKLWPITQETLLSTRVNSAAAGKDIPDNVGCKAIPGTTMLTARTWGIGGTNYLDLYLGINHY